MPLTHHICRNGTILLLLLALLLSGCADPYASDGGGETESPGSAGTEAPTPEEQDSGEGESDRAFTLGYYENNSLNPYTCNNTTNQNLTNLLYEPLFQQSPTFETESCLAQSCTTAGGTRWTLTLQTGVTFWNGEELDAADVVASLEAARQPDSIYAQRLAPLEDLEQTGENTLTFTWSEPLGDLTPLLDIPIVQSGTQEEDLPTGTGPYQPVEEEEQLTCLAAYSRWWQGEALPVEEIALYPVSDSDMLIYGFESGAITLVSTDLTGSNSLGYSGSFEVRDYATTYLLYLGCNTRSGLCREQDFRLALQAALDRETIADRLLSGHAVPSPLTFHPDSPWYDENLAKELSQVDVSGLAAYAGETVTILVNRESTFRTATGDFLAECLEEAGLEAEVSALAWSEYEQALEAGEYDLYLGQVRLEPDFDLTPFFDLNGSLNFSGYSADEITDALGAYLASGGEERVDRAYALSQAVSQQAPLLPLCFAEHSMLTNWGSLGASTATQSNLFYHVQDWNLDATEKEGRTAQ